MGQIFLKNYTHAAVIILITLIGMTMIIAEAVQISLVVLETIAYEGGPIDLDTIWETARHAINSFLTINLGFILIILGWAVGTVDAYVLGKKKDMM